VPERDVRQPLRSGPPYRDVEDDGGEGFLNGLFVPAAEHLPGRLDDQAEVEIGADSILARCWGKRPAESRRAFPPREESSGGGEGQHGAFTASEGASAHSPKPQSSRSSCAADRRVDEPLSLPSPREVSRGEGELPARPSQPEPTTPQQSRPPRQFGLLWTGRRGDIGSESVANWIRTGERQ